MKNKIFFFGSYAGHREVSPHNFNTVVPDALQRAGNFSENLPTTAPVSGLGACATSLSSADKADKDYGGKFFVCDPVTHQPVPGNRLDLDPNFVPDPVASAVLAKNVPLPAAPVSNRFTGNEGMSNNDDEYLIKGDFQLFPNHRETLEYFQALGSQIVVPGGNLPGWALSNYVYRQQDGKCERCLDGFIQLGQSTLVQLLAYDRGARKQPREVTCRIRLGPQCAGEPSLPSISVSSFFSLGQAITGPKGGDNVYGVRDVFTTTCGRHTFSFGGEGYLEHDFLETLLNNYGVFSLRARRCRRPLLARRPIRGSARGRCACFRSAVV